MNRRGFFGSIVALFVAKPLISLELDTLDVTRITAFDRYPNPNMGATVAAAWEAVISEHQMDNVFNSYWLKYQFSEPFSDVIITEEYDDADILAKQLRQAHQEHLALRRISRDKNRRWHGGQRGGKSDCLLQATAEADRPASAHLGTASRWLP